MRILLIAVTGLFLSLPLLPHHAFQAEFDENKPVTLKGKVVRMEWINPHSWIHIAVPDSTGKTVEWMVECGSPNIMLRRGFSKRSLEAGAELTVKGYQAKSGEIRANGSSVTFADGKRLFVGGSNPDLQENKGKGAPAEQ